MLTPRSSPQLPSRSRTAALLLAFLWLSRCDRERWEAPLSAEVKGCSPAAASVWYLMVFGQAILLLPASVRGQQTLGRVESFQKRASESPFPSNNQTANVSNSAPANASNSAPSNASNSSPANISNGAPANVSNGASANVSNGPPAIVSNGAPANVSSSAPASVSSSAPANASSSAPAKSSGEIHVFYHIFEPSEPEGRATAKAIVREQQTALKESGVEQLAAAVHYTAIGYHWEELVLKPPSVYRKTNASGPEGWEKNTLQLLWEHCVQAPRDKVLYIHSKGSFHSSRGYNVLFRKALMYSVLHPCCLEAISSRESGGREGVDGQSLSSEDMDTGVYDVCGMRYSATPFIAMHGNMWWARCDYIKRLIPPLQFQEAMDTVGRNVYNINVTDPKFTIERVYRGLGRYAFEHWVGSHPSLRAVDNLPFRSSPSRETYLSGGWNLPIRSVHQWEPVCSPAPRAEINLLTFLIHEHFSGSPMPSLQWKEYMSLYGNVSSSTMEHRRAENSLPSICTWWGRVASLSFREWAWLSRYWIRRQSRRKFVRDWLEDYKKERLEERCQKVPW